jgi:hypothetical protein
MKKTLTLFPLLSVTLLISPMLKAADFTFLPRVITGVMSHKYEDPLFNEGGVSAIMPFLGAGATLSYDRLFVDTYIQRSGEGEDGDSTLTREDYAIAFGYAVTDSLSISAGYRKGRTEAENITYASSGTPLTILSKFTTQGPFVGAAYGWLIGDGLLGVNLALTYLDNDYDTEEKSSDKPISYDFPGNTWGTTLGAHWKAPITKQLSYGASLDYYTYKFDGSDNNGFAEENFLALRASLSYRF